MSTKTLRVREYTAVKIHLTADVSSGAEIGAGTTIWHQAQVREGARIGANCVVGKGAYIDTGVIIGNNVKIQNYVSIYHGVTLEDGVFCGPYCTFTNDKFPRAINPDGSLKGTGDWVLTPTLVRQGASIGANATIVCGVTIGAWAMIGAGSVVTHDVPDYGLVWGNPARLRGFVCPCGARLEHWLIEGTQAKARCKTCGQEVVIPKLLWERHRSTNELLPDTTKHHSPRPAGRWSLFWKQLLARFGS
jgi:UDP-2-acetamido-3-amino-2,3-dideoxy-glucuronate N-acetyltransferase